MRQRLMAGAIALLVLCGCGGSSTPDSEPKLPPGAKIDPSIKRAGRADPSGKGGGAGMKPLAPPTAK